VKHLIIGGDGFIGRHIARNLIARGEEVVVADQIRSELDVYDNAGFVCTDVSDPAQLMVLPVDAGDIVYHLAARLLIPIMPRAQRQARLYAINYRGTENVLRYVFERGCTKLAYFSTDMVYGRSPVVPKTEDHPRQPLGPYGGSKLASEKLCETYRDKGMSISIFRPRFVVGPGRLGILNRLFRLIELHLPVPVIGNGNNHYQFISVFDCATAVIAAVERGLPNSAYNLGSLDPPRVNDLLKRLIKEAGSHSFLLHTPGALVKPVLALLDRVGFPLMDPEQYLIADENCILDVSKAERELGWRPRYRDEDMLYAAYQEYKNSRASPGLKAASRKFR
jgi:dTDP-glucose 4,6-dehydratase